MEAPTYKLVISSRMIDLSFKAHEIVKNPAGFRLLVFLEDRLDMLHDLRQKISSKYGPNYRSEAVQIAHGDVQNDRVRARYLIAAVHNSNQFAKKIPMQVLYGKCNKKERLLEVCVDSQCKFRPASQRQDLLNKEPASMGEEIHIDHKDVDLLSKMLQTGEDTEDVEKEGEHELDADATDALLEKESELQE